MGNGKYYLYRWTFPNGKVYVGISFDVSVRWSGNGRNYRYQEVYQYIEEFGWENIKREVLLCLPDTEENVTAIRRLEQEFIHAYGDRCYNQTQYAIQSYLTVDGVRKPTKDWCEEYGIARGKVMRRISRWGLTPKQALTFPPVPNRCGYNRDPMRYWREQGCFDEEQHATRA
jgi:hypothetical protein